MLTSIDLSTVDSRATRHLAVAVDGVRFIDLDAAALQPDGWIEAFRLAVASGRGVSHQARVCIQQHLARFSADTFTAREDDRRRLMDLLIPRPGVSARLLEMAECGLLECVFPELPEIHRRVAPDPARRYSAGVHAVLPVRHVETLGSPATPARARFSSMLEELRAPELLTLALLLHDVGTRRDHGHPRDSLRLAQPAIDRLQLANAAAETVRFLIRHHRQMARVAFRRDAENPAVVERFATMVGSEELLKMLCLLTLIDLESISPDALTPWKEERLWRLYTQTSTCLALGQTDEHLEQSHAGFAVAMAGRPEDISEAELRRFVSSLPRAYLSVFGLSTIYGHVRLARGILPHEVHASLEQHGSFCEMTVVTLDKPLLFSNIAGVLAYFGMDIHSGQAMRTPDDLVLAVFEFTDTADVFGQHRDARRRIQRMLESAVAGSVDMADLLRDKVHAAVSERRGSLPAIHLDNDQATQGTVLEIVADDAPGLLYLITRTLAESGCAVELALVSTEHGKAVDVLHITRAAQKLAEDQQQALRQSLERVLEAATGEGLAAGAR